MKTRGIDLSTVLAALAAGMVTALLSGCTGFGGRREIAFELTVLNNTLAFSSSVDGTYAQTGTDSPLAANMRAPRAERAAKAVKATRAQPTAPTAPAEPARPGTQAKQETQTQPQPPPK